MSAMTRSGSNNLALSLDCLHLFHTPLCRCPFLELQASIRPFRILAHDDQVKMLIVQAETGIAFHRSQIRIELKPPTKLPTRTQRALLLGVVIGPFNPTLVRFIDSMTSSGKTVPCFSSMSNPA